MIKQVKDYHNDRYIVADYVNRVHEGGIDPNSEYYQLILKLFKDRCTENNISFSDISKELANTTLQTIFEQIRKENNVNILFYGIDELDKSFIDNIEMIKKMDYDEKILYIDSLINTDFLHNSTKSVLFTLKQYLCSKITEYNLDVEIEQMIDIQSTPPTKWEWKFDPFGVNDYKTELNDNDKERYKKSLYLITTLPTFSKVYEKIRFYKNELVRMRKDCIVNKMLQKNPEYIHSLESLINHDKDCTYYYHGAQSIESAQQIADNGLYMQYEEITRTAKPELSIYGILNYSYGIDEVGREAIVVIDVPKVKNIVKENLDKSVKISGTSSGQQLGEFNPKYFIPNNYIVGYIDKISEQFIENPNYYKNQMKNTK